LRSDVDRPFRLRRRSSDGEFQRTKLLYSGRIEGGWRFATFLGGVAPYAAVQAQAFHTPAYNELDGTLGGFGLNYNARNGSDTRSELGARF
jgi:uncharacterized protein with beta-barrel porin domain